MSDTGEDYTAAELNRLLKIDNRKIENSELVREPETASEELYAGDNYNEPIILTPYK